VLARSISARLHLPLVAVTVLALAAACQGTPPSPGGSNSSSVALQSAGASASETSDLSVLEWRGYEAKDFWTDFASANPGVAVNFELGISDDDVLTRMESGSQADVFHFYTGWQQFYVDEGLVREIDTSKLTNWAKVPDRFKALGQVNGKQYFVPWDWSFTSILYNTDHVSGVDSWDALFDETYAGHIAMWDDGPAAVMVSSYIHGWDETAITDDQLAQIEEEWKDQKPLNLHYWTDEDTDLCPEVESGDIWLAYAWQGCYATVLTSGSQPVAYANPKEGRNAWVGLYGISAQSDSPELALKFIDAKLAALTCGNLVTELFNGCANQEVMAGFEDPVLAQAFALDDPSILEHTHFTPPVTQEQRDAWTAMWRRVKAE
jgi:spermidine/putrescine transport system substrate-binding protein